MAQFQGLVLKVVLQKVVCRLLTLQNFSEAEAKLNEEVKKFWDLDFAGICDEVSNYEKHASEIKFKKDWCEVG